MVESGAIKKLRQHFEYLKHAWKPHPDYETMDAIGYAIQALEKQEKIKEAFEMWKDETGGYYGADDETTRFISTLSQILRSDEAIEIVKQGGVDDDVCGKKIKVVE